MTAALLFRNNAISATYQVRIQDVTVLFHADALFSFVLYNQLHYFARAITEMFRAEIVADNSVGMTELINNSRFTNSGFPVNNQTMSSQASDEYRLPNTINDDEITHYTSSTQSTDAFKQSQFTNNQPKEVPTCPYGCCNTPDVPEYLFISGLIKGKHYDVIIKAFGKKYKLHKLLLGRSPYFNSLFSWSFNAKGDRSSDSRVASDGMDFASTTSSDSDSDLDIGNRNMSAEESTYRKVYELPFDTIDDPSSTSFLNKKKSFELAISRLYGATNLKEEFKIPYEMIEMGQYLAIPDVVCASTDFIVRNMDMSNLAENLRFAINSDFGSASQRIIENGKGILCSNGWEYGPALWDGIPTPIIAQTVGEDYFFVPTEWDRCVFIIKLIERRLESKSASAEDENESIVPLKLVLNDKIHYCHMSPDSLQELEEYKDINGENYVEPHVLHTALWQAVRLETMITRASDNPDLASIETSTTQPSKNPKWFKIPTRDETLSGLPKELDLLLRQSLSTTVQNELGSNDSKITQVQDLPKKSNEKVYNWTKIPPFRFSISFANVSELATDKRVYGKTFWYAGSYWNLYLQKSYISSKGSHQVGVYLHRAHSGSTNSNSKSGLVNPDVFADNLNYRSLPKKYFKKEPNHSVSYRTVPIAAETRDHAFRESIIDNLGSQMVDLSLSDDHLLCNNLSTSSKNVNKQSIINYEDERSAIKVYFIIFTPSRRSIPTITSFLSVPNGFSKSQSWGWKSNNMCVFNEDGTFAEGQDPNLKFMILLGNI